MRRVLLYACLTVTIPVARGAFSISAPLDFNMQFHKMRALTSLLISHKTYPSYSSRRSQFIKISPLHLLRTRVVLLLVIPVDQGRFPTVTAPKVQKYLLRARIGFMSA